MHFRLTDVPVSLAVVVAAAASVLHDAGAARGQCEVQEAAPSDPEVSRGYGNSVAVSGEFAVVGATNVQGVDHGYLLQRIAGTWTEVQLLQGSDTSFADVFGSGADIEGDLLIVGASGHRNELNEPEGAAYLFERDACMPGEWCEIKKLAPPVLDLEFGRSVALSGDTVIVGARGGASNPGAAFVYRRDAGGPGQWGLVQTLTGSISHPDNRFGESVDIDGDTAIVGAWRTTVSGVSEAGIAYVYERNEGGPDNWGEVATLTAPILLDFANVGYSVSISEDTAVVGAPQTDNSVYVHGRDEGGPGSWGRQATLTNPSSGDSRFGIAVSLSGDVLSVGDWQDDYSQEGAVYAFARSASSPVGWGLDVLRLSPPDGVSGDRFGSAVATDGGSIIVGAPIHTHSAPAVTGGGYLFDLIACGFVGFDQAGADAVPGVPATEAVGDLDGDGDEDAVIVVPGDGGGNGSIQVLLNQGTDGGGTWLGFVALPAIPVGIDPSDVVVGQFNGSADDDLDLAVSNAGDDTVLVLLNDGSGQGTFAAPIVVPVGTTPLALAAGDFNADGTTDLAVANSGDDVVSIQGNDGNAGFSEAAAIASPSGPCALDPVDLDNDRDTDLVIGNCGSASLIVWTQALAPGPVTTIAVGPNPVDLAVGDFNGDGFVDIASANAGDDSVSVVLNNGSGFDRELRVALPEAQNVVSVDAADLDNDGVDTLVVVDVNPIIGPSVRTLSNIDAGATTLLFEAQVDVAVSPDPVRTVAAANHVVCADLDANGGIDLLTVNESEDGSTGSVTALLNLLSVCTGDLDGSGDVGFGDVLAVIGAWGPCGAPCPADLSGNGAVDFADILIVIGAWGPCR